MPVNPKHEGRVRAVQLCRAEDGLVRKPPVHNSPIATVVFGGEEDGPDVGLVRVRVPAGAGMPPHKHNGSDVIISPVAGFVRIQKGDEAIEVRVGDSALIGKDEEVALSNPGSEEAEMIVSAGPASFITGIRAWPEPNGN